jgi:hypothetical protein
LLANLHDPISANSFLAWLPWRRTDGARLDLARARTTVTAVAISVVAGFSPNPHPVAAKRSALLAGDTTRPAGLDGLAIRGTAIARDRVAVVASLVGRQDAVATDGGMARAGLARVGAAITRFELAERIAAIAGKSIAIIALFAWFNDAISTIRHRDCGSRGGAA